MSTTDDPTPNGVTSNPNEETIAGLRAIADFLESNPQLVKFRGWVHAEARDSEARAKLITFAAALGDRATERLSYGERDVCIEGDFGGDAELEMQAPVGRVGGPQPVAISYPPILDEVRS